MQQFVINKNGGMNQEKLNEFYDRCAAKCPDDFTPRAKKEAANSEKVRTRLAQRKAEKKVEAGVNGEKGDLLKSKGSKKVGTLKPAAVVQSNDSKPELKTTPDEKTDAKIAEGKKDKKKLGMGKVIPNKLDNKQPDMNVFKDALKQQENKGEELDTCGALLEHFLISKNIGVDQDGLNEFYDRCAAECPDDFPPRERNEAANSEKVRERLTQRRDQKTESGPKENKETQRKRENEGEEFDNCGALLQHFLISKDCGVGQDGLNEFYDRCAAECPDDFPPRERNEAANSEKVRDRLTQRRVDSNL